MLNIQSQAAGSPVDSLPDRLLSDAEFREALNAFLAGPAGAGYAVRLTVISVDNRTVVATYESGHLPDDGPSDIRILLDEAKRAVTCRCELWRMPGSAGQRAVANKLVASTAALIDRHWGDRDPTTMLPFLKSATTPRQFSSYMRALAGTRQPVAVLHTDLDHFKQVNTEHGESIGDHTLREFADRFREAFSDIGVPVRTGGEEFSAILSVRDMGEVLRIADGLRHRMATEQLAAIGRINTCSIGLCLYPDAERFADVQHQDTIIGDARNAERRAKDEGRNRIALVGPRPTEVTPTQVTVEDIQAAALAARRVIAVGGGGAASEFTAAVVDRLRLAFARELDLATAVARVRDELGLLIGRYNLPNERSPELLGVIGSLEWAQLVARAMLASTFETGAPLAPGDCISVTVDAGGSLALDVGGRALPLNCKVSVDHACHAKVGAPFYMAGSEPGGGIGRRFPAAPLDGTHDLLSPLLLLPIGDAAKSLADGARDLVAAVVDVDDRPTRGGGLPDFWQSNVSRVIRACLSNPNIGTLLAIGDAANARLTLERLGADEVPNVGELQRRLSMKPDWLAAFAERGLRIETVPSDRAAVLQAIEKAVVGLVPLDFSAHLEVDQRIERSRRRLPIGSPDETHRLAITDGLRTRTLADAYPEALQLIRGAPSTLDQVEPQRGTFREMTGFKAVLTEPFMEMVPDYWSEDRTLLDNYYRESFAEPKGLFGSRLNRPFGGSTCTMVEFAAKQAAGAAERRIPTRRINLPISPDALDQPLGLSSIQVMPRSRDNERVLDVIYVWRTVDALVGFPFSTYGSIRWAQDFVARVNAILAEWGVAEEVRMGTLTYIALSFHMYLHEGDMEIARTIVQDASL